MDSSDLRRIDQTLVNALENRDGLGCRQILDSEQAAELASASSFEILNQALSSEDIGRRRRAALLLGLFGEFPTRVMDGLCEALRDPIWTVREAAVDSLVRIVGGLDRSHAAYPAGVGLLRSIVIHDKHELLRHSAAKGLSTINPLEQIAALSATLGTLGPIQRRRVILAIGQFSKHDQLVVAAIRPWINDSHRRVRRAVLLVLEDCPIAALECLPDVVRRRYDQETTVAAAAHDAVRAIKDSAPLRVQEWLQLFFDQYENIEDHLQKLSGCNHQDPNLDNEFVDLCRRRLDWIAQRKSQPVAAISDNCTVWEAVSGVLNANLPDKRRSECGWLLARACELKLQRGLPRDDS